MWALTISRIASRIVLTAGMLLFGILMILPFIWMLSTSFKSPLEVFIYPVKWIPSVMRWDNYERVWLGPNPFWLYYVNSFKVTFLSVLGTVFTSSAAAYGFSRIQFKGRDAVFLAYLATMMIPDQVTLIPRFILFNYLGIYNTHWSLILPGIITAFGVFMLRQFYLTVPKELSESARIDGANHLRIWWQIILPLSNTIIISLIIISFTQHWNEFVNPLIFLTDKRLFTVPLGLTNFIDDMGTEYTLMMAASVSAIFPVIVLFVFCQRYFIQGVISSGIKG